MRVAGQIRHHVTGEQVDLLAVRTEGKTVAQAGRWVELILGEHNETGGRNSGAVTNPVLPRRVRIIRQEPAADVDLGGCRIEQFDAIQFRPIGVGQNLIDDHRRNGRLRIIRAG